MLLVVVCCAWTFSLPLRGDGLLLGFAQDDFFYYLKAAQNVAAGRGSTFDGVTMTNGYHPLYFLLWTVASHFIQGSRAIFRVLWVLDMVAATTIFVAARSILRQVAPNAFLWNALAVVVLAPCIATISLQMETTLALPLGIVFLAAVCVPPERYTTRRCAALGLLGALTMLARLDAGILVFMFLLSLVVIRGMRPVQRPRNMAAFAATALPPLLLYFALNRHYFHEWLPISGAAKQLRHGWKPDLFQMRLSFAGFTIVLIAIEVVCGLAFLLWRRRFRPEEKVLCFAALLMPVIFYGIEIFSSSWKMWGWYMYATRYAFLASVLIVAVLLLRPTSVEPGGQRARALDLPWAGAVLLAGCLAALTQIHYRHEPVMSNIAQEDADLDTFARTHPGRYDMGDRAGMFAYLSNSPVLQAEGLMMDRWYLEHIRRQDDLVSTLKQYGANYYVYFVLHDELAARRQGTCMRVEEPSLPGKDSLRMRSTICDAPVATLPGPDGDLYVYKLQ